MDELIINYRKTAEDIVKIINTSNLPAFILKSLFREMLEQLSILEEQQYEEAKNKIQEIKKEKEEDVNE